MNCVRPLEEEKVVNVNLAGRQGLNLSSRRLFGKVKKLPSVVNQFSFNSYSTILAVKTIKSLKCKLQVISDIVQYAMLMKITIAINEGELQLATKLRDFHIFLQPNQVLPFWVTIVCRIFFSEFSL